MIGINRTSSDLTAILSLALSQITQLIVYMFVWLDSYVYAPPSIRSIFSGVGYELDYLTWAQLL